MSAGILFLLGVYRKFVSPFLGNHCRFYPACSEYLMEALERKGLWGGTVLGLLRLLRCHPFSGGGYDPVDRVRDLG
jgi:hypothetical protein